MYPFKRVLVWMVVVAAIAGYAGHYFGYNDAYDSGYDNGQEDMESYMTGRINAEKAQSYDDGYNAGYEDGYSDSSSGTSGPISWPSYETWSETVYITDTGEKYHRLGCQYLRESCIAIPRNEAISQGYTACSRCW